MKDGNWEFEYFLKDHLQSIRVVFVEESDTLKIIQENHNYAFGAPMKGEWNMPQPNVRQHYAFNGKERNSEYDLGWMDFGKRWYSDGYIPHFPTVDPISEDFAYLSTYNYASLNPVTNIDLWGLQGIGFGFGFTMQAAQKREQGASDAAIEQHYQSVQRGIAGGTATGAVLGGLVYGGVAALAYPATAVAYGPAAGEFLWGLGTDENLPGAADDGGRIVRRGIQDFMIPPSQWDNIKGGTGSKYESISSGKLLDEIIEYGTPDRVIGNYSIDLLSVKAENTFITNGFNINLIGDAKESISGIRGVLNALEAEARNSGASQFVFRLHAIKNEGFKSERLWNLVGYTFQNEGNDIIRVEKSLD